MIKWHSSIPEVIRYSLFVFENFEILKQHLVYYVNERETEWHDHK